MIHTHILTSQLQILLSGASLYFCLLYLNIFTLFLYYFPLVDGK